MAEGGSRYDTIGRTYSVTRREDRRVADQIHAALGPGSIVNVGAGSGNYEPADRRVVAVEPSRAMIGQRSAERGPVVQAVAEALPFADRSFDIAMAVLTLHHWSDLAAGLSELARVTDRQVLMFFEPEIAHAFWAIDYFPEARSLPTEVDPPGEATLRAHLAVTEIRPVLVPSDCVDGFGSAFWSRPEAYLDPQVQAGMSWLAMLTDDARARGTERLRGDLESGAWDRRHGHLRHETWFDGGYRLALAGST